VDVAVTGAVLTTAPPSHDQIDKYRSAQHPEDHRNWDFKRHDNGPANDIGQGYHHNAYHYHPGQVCSKVIPAEHRTYIGHDQPQEAWRTHNDGYTTGGDGHDQNAGKPHRPMI